MAADGPLAGSGPGDLTRWMSTPWHSDAASCRSGYEPEISTVLPTFWPARVPNHVLREVDYLVVVDTTAPMTDRQAAFGRRYDWERFVVAASPPRHAAQHGRTLGRPRPRHRAAGADRRGVPSGHAGGDERRVRQRADEDLERHVAGDRSDGVGRRAGHDAVVIGGGPAGCAAATTLARTGRSVVLVVDRRPHRTFGVGEGAPPGLDRAVDDVFGHGTFVPTDHLRSLGNRAAWGTGDLLRHGLHVQPLRHRVAPRPRGVRRQPAGGRRGRRGNPADVPRWRRSRRGAGGHRRLRAARRSRPAPRRPTDRRRPADRRAHDLSASGHRRRRHDDGGGRRGRVVVHVPDPTAPAGGRLPHRRRPARRRAAHERRLRPRRPPDDPHRPTPRTRCARGPTRRRRRHGAPRATVRRRLAGGRRRRRELRSAVVAGHPHGRADGLRKRRGASTIPARSRRATGRSSPTTRPSAGRSIGARSAGRTLRSGPAADERFADRRHDATTGDRPSGDRCLLPPLRVRRRGRRRDHPRGRHRPS